MADTVAILSGTSIGATSWVLDGSTHLRVYTQDKEYVIRETRFDGSSWSGGTSEDILIQATPNSPIAALTHSATTSSLKIRVYYISDDGFVREMAQDNNGKWHSGDLDHQLKLKAASNSRLAVIGDTWNDSTISLYYQKPDGAIAEVRWNHNTWVEGDTVVNRAPLGTGLAAVTFHTTKETGIRVYYQIEDGSLAEAHIDQGGKWYATGTPPGGIPKITDVATATNIAAYTHGVDAPNLEVQYFSKDNVLSEYRYYEDAWYGQTLPGHVTTLPGSGIALIQAKDYLSLKAYIQVEEDRIQELYWEKGFADWKKGAILPPQNA